MYVAFFALVLMISIFVYSLWDTNTDTPQVLCVDETCTPYPVVVHDVQTNVCTWQPWSECVIPQDSCLGSRVRYSSCHDLSNTQTTEEIRDLDVFVKQEQSCTCAPLDCELGTWSTWEPCSVSCGTGTTQRTRQVLSEPQHNGIVDGKSCEDVSNPLDGSYEVSHGVHVQTQNCDVRAGCVGNEQPCDFGTEMPGQWWYNEEHELRYRELPYSGNCTLTNIQDKYGHTNDEGVRILYQQHGGSFLQLEDCVDHVSTPDSDVCPQPIDGQCQLETERDVFANKRYLKWDFEPWYVDPYTPQDSPRLYTKQVRILNSEELDNLHECIDVARVADGHVEDLWYPITYTIKDLEDGAVVQKETNSQYGAKQYSPFTTVECRRDTRLTCCIQPIYYTDFCNRSQDSFYSLDNREYCEPYSPHCHGVTVL